MKPFNGYSWTELAERWDIADDDEDDGKMLVRVQERILASTRALMVRGRDDIGTAADVRAFLVVLVEQALKWDGPGATMWKAMLTIEDDWTFLSYAHDLLPHMWT